MISFLMAAAPYITAATPYMFYLMLVCLVFGIVLKCVKNKYASYAFIASGVFAILFCISIITITFITIAAFGKLGFEFLQFMTDIPY